jgi:prepilin-type N-terminal cleavage/methylation domain-containing protein
MVTARSVRAGFTLIELLVVVAIIAILSAVAVISLTVARNKGVVAGMQTNLHTAQLQAEFYYSSHGNSYGTTAAGTTTANCATGMFSADAAIASALRQVQDTGTTVYCGAQGRYYSISAVASAGSWCVNNDGVATTTPGC